MEIGVLMSFAPEEINRKIIGQIADYNLGLH